MAKDKTKENQLHVTVSFYDRKVNYNVPASLSGYDLLLKCCEHLKIFEPWWFGLISKDLNNNEFWIPNDKKLKDLKFGATSASGIVMKFRVKFYPTCANSEVIQTRARKIFYQDLRALILKEDIYCDPSTAMNLAALHLHFTNGGASQTEKGVKLAKENLKQLIPPGILKRHDVDVDKWTEMILDIWKSHECLNHVETLNEILKIICEMDMYGVRYYDIENKRKTKLSLGVDIDGMMIYQSDDKLVPKVALGWSEISQISYVDRKFKITPLDKSAPLFQMYSVDYTKNQQIMHICIGNHMLYLSRRREDSNEVKKLKEKAKAAEESEYGCFKKSSKPNDNSKKTLKKKMTELKQSSAQDVEQIAEQVNQIYEDVLKDAQEQVDKLEKEAAQQAQDNKITQDEVQQVLDQAYVGHQEDDYIGKSSESKQDSSQRKLKQTDPEEDTKREEALAAAADLACELERAKLELEALRLQQAEDQKKIKNLENAGQSGKKTVDVLNSSQPKTDDAIKKVNAILVDNNKARLEADKRYEEICQKGMKKHSTLKLIRKNNAKMRIDQFEAL